MRSAPSAPPAPVRRKALTVTLMTLVFVLASAVVAGPAEALPDIRVGYGFNEGSGTAIADTSSNNAVATATSPTWTSAGRFGNGIVFNGTSSRVRSNSNITLNGTFTLEAWVLNPGNQAYETIQSVGSDRDFYLANGTLAFYTGTTNFVFGAVAVNTWQHVALVSDGTSVRAYVEGTQVGAAQSATLGAVSGPLQVGSWIDTGGANSDFFSGTLDEVRVYNRALSAAEIATDRTTPVSSDSGGGGGGDTTPPVLSGGLPTGTLPAGTTQTTLQVTTNEAATCRFSTTAGTAYVDMTNTFTTTGGTAHSTTRTGLTNGSNYVFYVRCQDAAGNSDPNDFTITFSVAGSTGSQLQSWSSTTSLPSARSGNGAVYANGYLYLIGGIDSSGNVVSTVYVARTNANGTVGAWSTTTAVPVPIRSVRPVYYDGFIYLTGGTSNGSTYFATVYYAPVNANGTLGAWQTTTSLPTAQVSHTAVAYNGFFYVVGGNTGTCVTTTRYARINANGTLGNWTTTASLPEARCGVVESGAIYNGRLYLVAGFNNSNVTNQVFYSQISSGGGLGAWQTNATTLNTPREYTAVEAYNGYLFVLGGQTSFSGNITAATEQAQINSNGSVGSFSASTALPGPRAYLASEQANGYFYILGGGTSMSGTVPQSNVWYTTTSAGPGDTTPPVRSGGSPTGTLPAGTTQATLQLTTDEAATCRYSTTAGTAYAAMTNTFTTTGSTNHSTTVTGLQNGAQAFYVRCIDTAGNADTTDFPINFTIGGDTVAPTVSLTAPADNATVSGQVAVSATAADNVGVAGVQFLLDGNPLGSEDTTAPYSVNWNTGTATNASHTLTARARDAANNQTTSTAVTVTVNNAGPTDRLVGYAFSEGSGTAVQDTSTNNNDATATSPTWTTSGRYGNAITFNGTSTRVRSNDNLSLTGPFTLEAWVNNPSDQAFETVMSVGSGRDLFLAFGALSFYTGSTTLTFGDVPTNAWHHVAIVSDGTTVRAYIDGVQSGSTQNLALGTTSAPLQVGSYLDGSTNSDYFSGTIDEVHVYNRALTATEIAGDRDTPLN